MAISWNDEDAPIPPGTSYGYARVSTTDQDLDVQYDVDERAGCRAIRMEKVSGTSVQGRAELRTLLDFIRTGDELVVTRVDRLARSMGDLQDIIREVKSKGAMLRATEQTIDTSTPAGKAFLNMLGVFAEFKRTCGASGKWRGSRRPKPMASPEDGRPPSTQSAFDASWPKAFDLARSPVNSVSVGRVSGD